ncbi:MAG: flagellar basal body L-ring protein FlgH [Blastopirellula sp.]|nr:flagellar basal body L-ring protein FlgH [Blastopirellula sp.]
MLQTTRFFPRNRSGLISRWVVITGLLVCLTATTATLSAQSIYDNARPRYNNLFRDLRSFTTGDLLVVTIDQSTDVQNRDQRNLNKDASASKSLGLGFGLGGVFGTDEGSVEAEGSTDSTRTFNGNTQHRSERDFIDRFTVTIVDRLPNDNLLIAGKRKVTIDGDTRTLILTGVVRAIDITTNNTVSSRLVSQLELSYENDGVESKFLNQGWLGKKFNRWWPF